MPRQDRGSSSHSFAIGRSLGIFVAMLWAVGCSRTAGPPRFDLSGSVTYDGKPVAAGYILFAPDKSKGNEGPGAVAEIVDGAYRTRASEGTIGGPHVAAISGFDGLRLRHDLAGNAMGKPLFANVQISVDLPRAASSHDFVIPAQNKK